MRDFANILFAGPCNRACPFCIGQEMPDAVNGDNLDVFPPRGIERFIEAVNREAIREVVFTGTTTDPQLYRHQARLLDLLRARLHEDARFSVHTNGVRALSHLDVFNRYDRACISFPSFRPATYEKMMGSPRVPDLQAILRAATIPVKVSCVVNEHNAPEMDAFLEECSRIGVRRLVVRRLYRETRRWDILGGLPVVGHFRGNPVMRYPGGSGAQPRSGVSPRGSSEGIHSRSEPPKVMEVTYWDFDESACRSINLFADGTLGTSYLLTKTPELARGPSPPREPPPRPAAAP